MNKKDNSLILLVSQDPETQKKFLNRQMRWECSCGCFNEILRPKLEVFVDCFPGSISFGDVDGLVERNGYGLLLEWKSLSECDLSYGQERMYRMLTETGLFTVIVCVGSAKTMEVTAVRLYSHGKQYPSNSNNKGWKKTNLNGAKKLIRIWFGKANVSKLPKGLTY